MGEVGDLQIHEDIDFQEREWTLVRFGWFGLLVLVGLSAVGLFGHGPISWTSASSGNGDLEVSFERFGRRGGSQALVVRAAASAARGGAWEIDVSREYASAVHIGSITPQPDAVDTVEGGVRYTFTQADPSADLEVTFSVTPASLWATSGDIRLAGGDPVRVRQFFFP